MSSEDRFMAMVAPHERIMRRFAVRYVGETHAEAALQTTLLGAWNKYRTGFRPDNPRAWLMREDRDAVLSAVAGLPERQREALIAQAVHGESARSTAERLGIAEGAVRMLVYRGRAETRQRVARAA